MAFIPVSGVVEVAMLYTVLDIPCVNTLYFQGDAAWDPTNMQDLSDDVLTWWGTGLQLVQHAGVFYVGNRITDLTTATAPSFLYPFNFQGSDANPASSNNVSGTVTFRTGSRGRSYRGRNYLLGITELNVTGNVLLSTYRDDVQDAYEGIPTAITANGANHVVVSRYTNGAPRVSGIATPVVSYDAHAEVKTQRRRLT